MRWSLWRKALLSTALESAGRMRFVLRSGSSLRLIDPSACVEHAADKPLFTLRRRQETELPAAIKLTYVESARDYRQAAVESAVPPVRVGAKQSLPCR